MARCGRFIHLDKSVDPPRPSGSPAPRSVISNLWPSGTPDPAGRVEQRADQRRPQAARPLLPARRGPAGRAADAVRRDADAAALRRVEGRIWNEHNCVVVDRGRAGVRGRHRAGRLAQRRAVLRWARLQLGRSLGAQAAASWETESQQTSPTGFDAAVWAERLPDNSRTIPPLKTFSQSDPRGCSDNQHRLGKSGQLVREVSCSMLLLTGSAAAAADADKRATGFRSDRDKGGSADRPRRAPPHGIRQRGEWTVYSQAQGGTSAARPRTSAPPACGWNCRPGRRSDAAAAMPPCRRHVMSC